MPRDREKFDAAIHTIAETLDTATTRTDYGKRRDALKNWSISSHEWDALIAVLPTRPRPASAAASDNPTNNHEHHEPRLEYYRR